MSKKIKVAIADFIEHPATIETEILGPGYELRALKKQHTEELLGLVSDVDALMVWHELKITKEIIDSMPGCRIISRMGVGFDNVDLKYAREKEIVVSNVPDYGTDVVADHAMAFLLSLTRKLNFYNEKFRQDHKNWDPLLGSPLRRLAGKQLGIVGLGRIGTAVALRAKAFGLDVCFYDPYLVDGVDKAIGIKRVGLDSLLSNSDIISIHTPATAETRGMVDTSWFERMKKDVLLINTARGEVIQWKCLCDALRANPLMQAGLDVIEKEPPPEADELLKAWRNNEDWIAHRIEITPHAAFNTVESFAELRTKGALRIKNFFEKQEITNRVN